MFSACNCAAEYYTAIVFFTLYPNLLYLKSGIPENLNVKVDCVIVAVAHDEFKINPFLAQVLSLERKCIDGCFDSLDRACN
jgi:hypothetical protein